MDGTQFDSWTRRRFGLATGGAAASLLGLFGLPDAEAKKKNKKNKKNNKNKKKKCRKLGQTCDINVKKKSCCSNKQDCAQVQGLGSSTFCCKALNDGCSVNTDCCGNRRCNNGKCVNP
jgi:hypothetical protein